MASNISQVVSKGKEQFRDGDGEEDEEEEILDPRVKGELDRLNSSTAEINRLEQELEELQAAFRQTLTESAYVLNSQAAFLGKCVKQSRPYYDAVRKAKQSQVETQKAALKYERACSSHQAAKKMLAMAEQKLTSTSNEHKILDPSWQEMLNQTILKVMESDKERALSEREHLETARAFSEAGSRVTELRTKLKSAINKSRPYFDLKTKYDQILEAHKRQVEITQESLQDAKRKYSLALKNLEDISEEIHEMRRSRDSLDMILQEREEGVGAESPDGDLSHDTLRPQTELEFTNYPECMSDKPSYGFKIALVSASKKGDQAPQGVTVGLPVGERDGDPEGCSSFDEQQLGGVSKDTELSGKSDSGSDVVMREDGDHRDHRDEAEAQEATKESTSVTNSHEQQSETEAADENTENELCPTDEKLAELVIEIENDNTSDHRDEAEAQEATKESTSVTNSHEQQSETEAADENTVNQNSTNGEESRSAIENVNKSDHIDENAFHASLTENSPVVNSHEQQSKTEVVSENNTVQNLADIEEFNSAIQNGNNSEHAEVTALALVTEDASVSNSEEQQSNTEVASENDVHQQLPDLEELKSASDNDRQTDHVVENAVQENQ